LLKDNTFTVDSVAGYAEQLNTCVRSRDTGDAGSPVYLEHGITDGDRLTVTMRDIPHRVWFGTECFACGLCIKFRKIGRYFWHRSMP